MNEVFHRFYSSYSRQKCLENRAIILSGEITSELAQDICAQLLVMESQDRSSPITMFITSVGGCVLSGLAIFDTIKMISCEVHTVVIGYAYSMGAIILLAGTKRIMLPNSQVMIHQVITGSRGKLSDVLNQINVAKSLQDTLFSMIAEVTGKNYEEVEQLCNRDKYYGAQEALKEKLITEIAESRKIPLKSNHMISA